MQPITHKCTPPSIEPTLCRPLCSIFVVVILIIHCCQVFCQIVLVAVAVVACVVVTIFSSVVVLLAQLTEHFTCTLMLLC